MENKTAGFDMSKVREGNTEEFKKFFELLYPKLMALACRFVDEYVAKDLVQEVFASYWERKDSIRANNIQSFLYRWLQNSCLDYIKHQMVVEDYELKIRMTEARIKFISQTTDTNDIIKQVISQDIREVIEASVIKLPPRCAQAFRLCYYHDMSYKEIAEVMNISHRTVEVHVQQAIKLLRKELKSLFILLLAFQGLGLN